MKTQDNEEMQIIIRGGGKKEKGGSQVRFSTMNKPVLKVPRKR